MKRKIRQHKILNLIAIETGISAGMLAKQLRVSRMTIHRDLAALAARGHLRRIHGGALHKNYAHAAPALNCPICQRKPLPHQQAEIISPAALETKTCCTTCGLRYYLTRTDRAKLWVRDLLTGQRLAAEQAFFLINSAAVSCCQPSTISFAQQNQLALFQTGFGGTGARLADALDFLRINHHLFTANDETTDNQPNSHNGDQR